MKSLIRFLDYTETKPNAKVHFYASDIILTNHSDASYFSEPKLFSRPGGHFYMGNKTTN